MWDEEEEEIQVQEQEQEQDESLTDVSVLAEPPPVSQEFSSSKMRFLSDNSRVILSFLILNALFSLVGMSIIYTNILLSLSTPVFVLLISKRKHKYDNYVPGILFSKLHWHFESSNVALRRCISSWMHYNLGWRVGL